MSNNPPNDPNSAPLPEILRGRETRNALAFLSHVVKGTGGELRPPGLYTLNCMKLLDMLTTEGDDAKPVVKLTTAIAATDLSNTYLFLHAAPVPQVERAVRAYVREKDRDREEAWENFIADKVAPFLSTLAPEELVKLQDELGKLDEIAAAQVTATPPDRAGKTELPDPN